MFENTSTFRHRADSVEMSTIKWTLHGYKNIELVNNNKNLMVIYHGHFLLKKFKIHCVYINGIYSKIALRL